MSVRSYYAGVYLDGSPRGSRIVVSLDGSEHRLDVAEATGLRDELTRHLGQSGEPAVQHLSPVERETWAKAYESSRATGAQFIEAYTVASNAVAGLRTRAASGGDVPALTDREAMVWAAEYVRALANDVHLTVAARAAHHTVTELRRWSAYTSLPDDVSEMLSAMTGGAR